METTTRYIELASGKHTYCDIGNSDHTLLLLHGLSFRHGLYPLIEELAPGFRILALDLPFSDRHGFRNDHTLDHYVDFVLDFIDKLALKNLSFL